ncbi:group II truncated hemoglobin [Simiduia sp. 21SJ11W-1]|uniref:group II truncated hemoglobin n=1 Tax=Simiduia sp. 21SJ11W-1 TaxID=2909669 RepID=UPI00209D1AE2|nr:group II truncated hemoglobin [Simiduia sp. 21SJ11W-1]UTA48915.1 group II truncated hemoglobin [Simiduia sp. 21SJ11W-1]
MIAPKKPFGLMDNSFQSAGGYEGVKQLVDVFYDEMAAQTVAEKIHHMHTDDAALRRDKLTRFLCGWLGGPRLFSETYGPINIPKVHAHLDVGEAERDAWLFCMERALARMPYDPDFKHYLQEQLKIPAERIRQVSQMARRAQSTPHG